MGEMVKGKRTKKFEKNHLKDEIKKRKRIQRVNHTKQKREQTTQLNRQRRMRGRGGAGCDGGQRLSMMRVLPMQRIPRWSGLRGRDHQSGWRS